jgi:aldehyde dehydrogenase (NAD+)
MNPTISQVLNELGLSELESGVSTGNHSLKAGGALLVSVSPVDGLSIGSVRQAGREDYEQVMGEALRAFEVWRQVPAPRRGEFVRLLGEEFRRLKEPLGWSLGFLRDGQEPAGGFGRSPGNGRCM